MLMIGNSPKGFALRSKVKWLIGKMGNLFIVSFDYFDEAQYKYAQDRLRIYDSLFSGRFKKTRPPIIGSTCAFD